MIPALVSLKSLIKNKSYHIDYPLFRLHYQATVCALLAFCLILTAKILFGDTIDCKSRADGRDEFSDNLCYSQGTYTHYVLDIPESFSSLIINPDQGTSGLQVNNTQGAEYGLVAEDEQPPQSRYLYPGIPIPDFESHYPKKYWHRYYQYIPIILFLQAVFFYFPHYLWKFWENGIISSICKQLHDNRFSPGEFIDSNYHIIDYLQNCFTLHRSLVYKYYFCHLLLLVNLITQVIVLDCIFNYQYLQYGYDVIWFWFFDESIYKFRDSAGDMDPDFNNPMNFVFPKVTCCQIKYLSKAGGKPDTNNYLCVLPLNILHDKFFFILWLWFLVLAAITIVQIIFDSLYITIPKIRIHLFRKRFGPYLTQDTRSSYSLPELFLLDLIGSNSDKFAFSALLNKLNNSGLV